MINTEKLKAEMSARGLNATEMAKRLGMSFKTYYTRMKRREFMSGEIEKIIDVLDLKQPWEIFFPVSDQNGGE